MRPPQLFRNARGIREIVWQACVDVESCADTEPHVDAEPPHPPHEFGDFANLLAPDCAAELSKWSTVSLWIVDLISRNRVDLLSRHWVTGPVRPCSPFKLVRFSSLSAYQVRPIPPNPAAATTESQIAVTGSARSDPRYPVRLDSMAANVLYRQ